MISKVTSKIRRKIHKRTVYKFPETCDGWEKLDSPVLGGTSDGSIYDPCIRKVGDIYVMFVSHRNSKSIIRYESLDGYKWKNPIVILKPKDINLWDNRVCRGNFIIKNDVWYLWYTGMCEGYACIGLAVSNDGINFERCQADPIITPEQPFEKNAVMNPCVIWDSEINMFKMWYSAGNIYEPDILCYATSDDGIKWEKYSGNPIFEPGQYFYDKYKVGGCDVVKYKDSYYQFYIGYENVDNARICLATSLDGILWKRNKNNPILSATPNGWDADAVYKPSIYIDEENSVILLWYNGRTGNTEHIGLARKKLSKS